MSLECLGREQSFSGGDLHRLRFGDGAVIAKLAPAAPGLRCRMAPLNAAEVCFYRDYAAGLLVPKVFFAAADAGTGASLVLLEDLGADRQVPFQRGLDPGALAAVVDTLAANHARYWNAPELQMLSGTALLDHLGADDLWRIYPATLKQVLPEAVLSPRLVALLRFLSRHGRSVFADLLDAPPLTLVHRDCQPDNLCFDAAGRAILLDWQMMGRGRGAFDLAYALITSATPATRRLVETSLVADYHAGLSARGVTGYTLSDCWRDYLRSSVGKLLITAMATVSFDAASPAKRAWRATDLARLTAFVDDHRIAPDLFA